MKKIIIIAALFCSFAASAQKTTPGNYTYIAQKYEWDAGIFKGLGIPSGSGPATFITGQVGRAGALYYDSVGTDSGFYVYTGTYWRNHSVSSGGTWGSITGTLSDQTDLQSALDLKAPLASPTFTGTVTIPTPFTLGATSVTSTGTQLNYLNAATGTTGTASTNLVYSTSPLFVTPRLNSTSTIGHVWTATDGSGNGSFQASAAGITGLTSPRIPYASSATTLTDDANFYRIVTPGIQGNTGFTSLGQVSLGKPYNTANTRNTDYVSNGLKSYQLEIIGDQVTFDADSTASGQLAVTSYGSTGGNSIHSRIANGTFAAPTSATTGQRSLSIGGKGYISATGAFSNSTVAILGTIDENYTANNLGSSLIFETTQLGTAALRENRMILHNNGNVGIGPSSVTTTPSAQLTIQTDASTGQPTVRLNDGHISLPSYSSVGFSPALDANTLGQLTSFSTTAGGMQVMGFSESGANTTTPLTITGYHGGTAPTAPGIGFPVWKWNGTTNRTTLGATEIIAQFLNGTGVLTTLLGGGNFGIGTVSPDRLLHPEISDATTNSIVYPFRASHTTSGTAAIGGGVGMELETENASGTMRVTGSITNPMTDATNATEDADYTINLIRAGTLTEGFRVTSVGGVTVNGSAGTAGQVLTSGGTGAASTWTNKTTLTKNATIENPTASENMGMFRTPVAITITNTHAVLVGSGSPSVTYQISFGTDITALTNVYTAGQTVTSTTTGTAASGVNDATIPADSWIRITTSAQSGTVGQISLSITYTED